MARAIVNGIEREVPPLRFPLNPPRQQPPQATAWRRPRWLGAHVVGAWLLALLQIPIVLIDPSNQIAVACAVFTLGCAIFVTRSA